MVQPLVSIILPTYNGSKFLQQSIDSCLKQTYSNIELIIVDDCSTDSTPDIIKSNGDHRIKYIRHEKNKKLPLSLNTGFANASGAYLTWTSDDNYFVSSAIEIMLSFLIDNQDVDFVYTDYYTIDEIDNVTPIELPSNLNELLYRNVIGACFLYKRTIYDKIGGYDKDFFLCEDYEYWLRIYISNYKMVRLSSNLYYYRTHSNSLTSTVKAKKMQAIEIRLIKKVFNSPDFKYHYIKKNIAMSRCHYRTAILFKGSTDYLSAFSCSLFTVLYNPFIIFDIVFIKLVAEIMVSGFRSFLFK